MPPCNTRAPSAFAVGAHRARDPPAVALQTLADRGVFYIQVDRGRIDDIDLGGRDAGAPPVREPARRRGIECRGDADRTVQFERTADLAHTASSTGCASPNCASRASPGAAMPAAFPGDDDPRCRARSSRPSSATDPHGAARDFGHPAPIATAVAVCRVTRHSGAQSIVRWIMPLSSSSGLCVMSSDDRQHLGARIADPLARRLVDVDEAHRLRRR